MTDDSVTPLREPAVRRVERRNGAVVVALAGELDLYTADEVRGALTDAIEGGAERVVVDLSGVKFIDSTALGVLVEARSRMPNRRAFLLAAPGLETKRALEVSGLDKHFSVHESRDAALAATV